MRFNGNMWSRNIHVFATLAVLIAPVVFPVTLRADDLSGSQTPAHRIVHRFDFDERDEGNLEDLPKFWEQFRPAGFPRFTRGAFDFDFGHSDEASFYLSSRGRNVAFQYNGPETRIQPNTNYLIEGYVHPDHLIRARAWLSAHFLDEGLHPIGGTLVRSVNVEGGGEAPGWTKVQMYLPPAPPQARTIGLIAWVVQEPVWNTTAPMRRHIPRNDVSAGAWFDDISIHALPQLSLTTSSPGNVLLPDSAQELRIVLADYCDTTLLGKLTVTSSEGEELLTGEVPVSLGKTTDPARIDVGHLAPGVYHAGLRVMSGDVEVVTKNLTFAILGELSEDTNTVARPFGLVVEPGRRSNPATELNLLENQGIGSVKLPAWSGMAEAPSTPEQHRGTSRLLRSLVRRGFSLTGVLFGPPGALVESAGPYPRSLVEILSEDPDAWRDHLAAVVAPNASMFGWWQIGADNDPDVVEDIRLVQAVQQLRREMLPFLNRPLLVVPGSTSLDFDSAIPSADQFALTMDSDVHPIWFHSEIDRAKKLGYDRLSVYIEPLPGSVYSRLPRLADYTRRIILARHAGADTVYVPQTWHVRSTPQGPVAEPTEEYIIVRTIAGMLSDALPGGQLRIAAGVEALVFHHGKETVLALWDSQAPPEGNSYAVQLGRARRQVDCWGRSTPLERDKQGRQIVTLTPEPVFIDDIERWLVEFRTSVELTPQSVDFGDRSVSYKLHAINNSTSPLSGNVHLAVPESWEVVPGNFPLSLPTARKEEVTLDLRFPHTEPAGVKTILAQISLNQGPYYIEVPLSFELGLSDVDVWGMVIVEGEDLLLRQIVTNLSADVLHFRGSANVPSRARQYQPITNLLPGDTTVAEYRFTGGASLTGRSVRLILRELNDGSRLHNLELTVP